MRIIINLIQLLLNFSNLQIQIKRNSVNNHRVSIHKNNSIENLLITIIMIIAITTDSIINI